MIRFLKIFCAAGFLVVLVSNIVSISGWKESRAVYDDICYLRQAHLFEQYGLGGMVPTSRGMTTIISATG
jgi:hypothetical protein